MGGKSSAPSSRPVTEEERALWDSQKTNLDMMTKIAEDQYNLSVEDRDYYEQVFREGSDTQAKEALAKLQETITGNPVDPASIASVDIDSLLRDTILTASPEFQEAASGVITSNEALTKQYGADVSGLSSAFSKSITGFTEKYSGEIEALKQATGTINQDILAQETGAAYAGIGAGFEEARKQMSADMARRGLAGSGVEAQALMNTYQQEAIAKGQASTAARTSARGITDAINQQQASLAATQYQANAAGASEAYNAQMAGIQNVYGVTTASQMQNYQTQQAATLQGIAGLTQVAQAGQGIYTGSANYLAGAASTAGSAAQTAGQTMTSMIDTRVGAETAANNMQAEMIGSVIGAVGTYYGAK